MRRHVPSQQPPRVTFPRDDRGRDVQRERDHVGRVKPHRAAEEEGPVRRGVRLAGDEEPRRLHVEAESGHDEEEGNPGDAEREPLRRLAHPGRRLRVLQHPAGPDVVEQDDPDDEGAPKRVDAGQDRGRGTLPVRFR